MCDIVVVTSPRPHKCICVGWSSERESAAELERARAPGTRRVRGRWLPAPHERHSPRSQFAQLSSQDWSGNIYWFSSQHTSRKNSIRLFVFLVLKKKKSERLHLEVYLWLHVYPWERSLQMDKPFLFFERCVIWNITNERCDISLI